MSHAAQRFTSANKLVEVILHVVQGAVGCGEPLFNIPGSSVDQPIYTLPKPFPASHKMVMIQMQQPNGTICSIMRYGICPGFPRGYRHPILTKAQESWILTGTWVKQLRNFPPPLIIVIAGAV